MKVIPFFYLLLALTSFTSAYEEKDGIIVLNDKNFHEVVKSFKMIMVAFYAPWCNYCKELIPEYIKAAAILKESPEPVPLAKIDATKNPKLSKEFNIKAYPTIKLFHYEATLTFMKTRTAEELVGYIQLKQKDAIEKFTTAKEIKDFISNKTVATLLSTIPEGEPGYLEFLSVSRANEWINFAQCLSSECKTQYQAPLIMLTNFDEKEVKYKEPTITVQSINRFIEIYSIELGGLFNDYAAEAVFDYNKTCLFYFRSESDPHKAQNDILMKAIAKDFRDKIYIFVADIEGNELFKESADYFFVTKDLLPQIQMINIMHEDDVRMYIMKEKTINEKTVRQFIQDYFEGKIKKELLSEGTSDLVSEMVEFPKLIGRNYVEKVIKSEKSYFVLLYVLGEPKGRDYYLIWKDLNNKYQDNEEVIFAGIDLSKNEVEDVTKDQAPLIRLYLKGDKQNPKEYNGKSSLIEIEEWMAEQIGWTQQTTESTTTSTESTKKDDL